MNEEEDGRGGCWKDNGLQLIEGTCCEIAEALRI